MADNLSPEHRSWNMSRIRGKDTSIEVKVRKYLFARGFRFRKNDKRYPGTPDIVLPKYHTMIFIHGCFWHRHQGCRRATTPSTRQEYWLKKFERNVENDCKHKEQMKADGWRVIVLWECEINNQFEETMRRTVNEIIEN